ncbi:MAG TPA: hypothetical protein VFJ97_10300 [Dermatophilaceae bacterium]|nr:hypothetical protein [Dermatophilaceae bacterium]
MDPAAQELVQRCTDLVRGRRVVLVGGVLAGSTRRVQQLRSFGAADVLVVAEGLGTGGLPTPAEATSVVVEPTVRAERISDEVAGWIAFAADPPAPARAAVERFDPDHSAVCLLGPFATVADYLGRTVLGGRTPAAQALEDKTLADGLWDRAGVARAPSAVVECRWVDLREAMSALDRGDGTVWAADASDGVNGAGDGVRWVRDGTEARAALDHLAAMSRRVRVMPFLPGVPCSIHGFVVDGGVAAFRPVELAVLRGVDGAGLARFVSAGISSCWEPPATDREVMRDVARRVGAHLAQVAGFRGGFSVDGVLTAQGFLPTELNPRFSGGLNTIAHGVPELPLELLQGAVVRGVDVGARPEVVEQALLPAADARPFGAMHAVVTDRTPARTEAVVVTGGPGRLAPAAPGDPVAGTLELGPSALGGLVRFVPAEQRPGMRFASWSVAALALADRLWHTGFGELHVAPEVRH